VDERVIAALGSPSRHGADLDDAQRRAAYARTLLTARTTIRPSIFARQHEVRFVALRAARPPVRIVDEVDSILIDEARTPLIISGPPKSHGQVYASTNYSQAYSDIDYTLERKASHRHAYRRGVSSATAAWARQSLRSRAHGNYSPVYRRCARTRLYKNDVDYVVKDGEVIIVDESRAAKCPGRPLVGWYASSGRKQEAVKIERENQTTRHHHLPELFRMSRSSPA